MSVVQPDTEKFLALVADAVLYMDSGMETWEQAAIQAKEDLNELTRAAVVSTTCHLNSDAYKLRAQELAIRIDMLELLMYELQKFHNT
jgi:hypothetical protein